MIFSFIFDTDLKADHKTKIKTKMFFYTFVLFFGLTKTLFNR